MRVPWLPIVLVLLAAAGCGDRTAPGGQGGDPGLRGRTFLSTSVTENGGPRPLAERTRVRLQFTDDGRLLADAGCNTMGGQVSLDEGRLAIADLQSTGAGCEAPLHEQDTWLSGFLSARPSWRVDGTGLVLSSSTTEVVLQDRKVAEPDVALLGTRWAVETLVDGQAASSVPSGTEASLVFEADTVRVSAGCNTGSGGYRMSGGTIRFDAVATTRKACEPDRMTLETAVLAVLSGEVTFEIDADQLILTHPSGKELVLRAQR
jgi:heat shock protein HslJ